MADLIKIKEKITPDFLNTLKEVAKIYGWRGDYAEIKEFVCWCFDEAKININFSKDLEPHE